VGGGSRGVGAKSFKNKKKRKKRGGGEEKINFQKK